MNYILVTVFICNVIGWPLGPDVVPFWIPKVGKTSVVCSAEFNYSFESIEMEINEINGNNNFMVPYRFIYGTERKYEEVNENFKSIEREINRMTKNDKYFRVPYKLDGFSLWSKEGINSSFKAIEDKLNEIRGE